MAVSTILHGAGSRIVFGTTEGASTLVLNCTEWSLLERQDYLYTRKARTRERTWTAHRRSGELIFRNVRDDAEQPPQIRDQLNHPSFSRPFPYYFKVYVAPNTDAPDRWEFKGWFPEIVNTFNGDGIQTFDMNILVERAFCRANDGQVCVGV